MNKIQLMIIALVIIFLSLPLAFEQKNEYAQVVFMSGDEEITEVELEVAETPEERRTGLMNRHELESDGMLFIFEDEETRTFWMKNTYIPLDMIFVAENGSIVDIQQADPEPYTPEEELERYVSSSPAKYVIEVEQGFSDKKGINEDSSIEINY